MTHAFERVLITGAGSGLGLALAHRFARDGARVACVDVRTDRVEAAAKALPGEGHLALVADVADDAQMDALRDRIQAEWGGLDILVNNAGIASGGPLVGSSMDEWRRILEVNLLGVVRGCQRFVPGMVAQGHGHVLSTASFAALAGAPGIMSYGVSKSAVYTLSEQLRAELHGTGVKVSVACPAFFKTNLMESAIGAPEVKTFGEKMMARSPDTVDTVADRVHAGVRKGEFLILPTRDEPMRWRLKRWFPEFYFRQLCRMSERVRKAYSAAPNAG